MRWFKKLERELKKDFKEQKKELKMEEKLEKSLYEEALEKCKKNEEMWVDVKGVEGYIISNFGRVINKKTGEEEIQRPVGKRRDTATVQPYVNGIRKTYSVGKLVGESFEVPNPTNSMMIYHLGDKLNNRIDNLTYDRTKQPRLKLSKEERQERKNKKYEKIYNYLYGDKENEEVEYSDKDRIDNELANNKNELLNDEIWKWVVGYERWYEVSNKGNVRKINDDGSKKLLKACDVRPNYTRGRIVNLVKAGEPQKVRQISNLVAEAFNLKPTDDNSKTIYHIDGNINNDYLSNLTYDIKETEKYIEEQRKLKEEQERLEKEKQEKENHKEELLNYIEENKDFLKQSKEINNEVTIKDVYNKLCEILEVLKDERK